MAAEEHSENMSYPNKYNSDTPFSDEDILTAEQMNFIASNLNAIITALSWNGEITEANKTTPISEVQMSDES